jgi:hypothetical protein
MVSNFLLKKCLSKYTRDSQQCLMKVAGYQSPEASSKRPAANGQQPETSGQMRGASSQ